MPGKKKKMTGGRRKKRVMRGGFGWGDIWDGVKKVGGVVNDGLKATKVISRLAPLIPGYGGTVGAVANQLGYGRRRMRGRGMMIQPSIIMA